MGQQIHWKLTVRDGSRPPFAVMLTRGDKFVVGRSRTCEILLADLSVSRKHCLFGVGEDGVLKLVDLGAQHPTLLNGAVVKEGCAVPVRNGGRVRLGRGSLIDVECLGEKLPDGEGRVDPGNDDLEHTHAGVSETSVLAEVAEVGLGDDPFDNGETGCSKAENPDVPEAGMPHTRILQPGSREGDDEKSPNHEKPEEKDRIRTPLPPSEEPASLSGQQEKTSLVGGEVGDLNLDEATKPSHVDALKQSKKDNGSAPGADADHNHADVLGKTLQGKLILPKKSNPDPVLNNTVRNGSGNGVSNSDSPEETSYVDPAELLMLMQGKAGIFGKKGAAPKAASKKRGDEAGKTGSPDGDSQDETSYVDPAELQRLMQGKAGIFGKKGAAPKAASKKRGDEAGKTGSADGDSLDETSYVDPAELQKLMQGKAGIFGKKGAAPKAASKKRGDEAGKTGSADGDSPDETSYVDPAELQRLMQGKAKAPWSSKGRAR